VDYWEECISEALDDAGVTVTKEQLDTITSWVEGAHDNYGLATGSECIPNPLEAEIKALKADHEKEVAELEEREQCYKRSVATRRGTKPENVWLENGDVVYE